MSVQKRKSADDRKAEIIATAIRLAGELGPDRLTTQKLADEIGITQPAIFRHFTSKGAIWQAVAEQLAQIMRTSATKATRPDLSPAGQLSALIIAHLGVINSTPALPAILFSRELHAENEELRAFFATLMAGRHSAFSSLISAEIAHGGFRHDLNATDAAYLILSLIQGLAMRWSLSAHGFDLVSEGERLLELQINAFR